MTPLLLALDPSLTCTGALLVSLDGRSDLVACDTCETEAGRSYIKGESLEAQHDAGRRAVELFVWLSDLIAVEHPGVKVVALETPHGAQDANAAWAMARAHTATRCALAATLPGLRPIAVSQFEAKRWATGTAKPKDPKRDVKLGASARFGPTAWERVFADAFLTTDRQREAVYDAGAVAIVALRHAASRLIIEDHTHREEGTTPWT